MWQIINDFTGNILLVTGMFLFTKIILNKRINIEMYKFLIYILFSVLLYTIIMIYFDGAIKTVSMILILFMLNKTIFKETFGKTIFITVLYAILSVILDIFVLFFATEILNLSKNFCYNVFAGSIIGNLIIQVLIIAITFLIRKVLRKILKTEISNNNKIIILSFATFICIAIFFYMFAKEFRIDGNSIPYLVAIIVFSIILFSLIKQTIDNYKLTNEYDKLLEFMTTYENEIENQRILRHEVKNEFRTIRAKICDKQANKEIIEYIDEIVKDKYEVNKEKYAKFGYLPPNGIKGLCYFKTQEAEKRNVNVAVNISKKVKNSIIYNLNTKQQRDFGRILGVILDNAIEASAESEKKQLGIEAYISPNLEFKLIVSNTFNNEIEESKIGKERFSTKGKNRGHGLLLVKQLVNKNDIFEVKREIQENLYIQVITIKNKIVEETQNFQ